MNRFFSPKSVVCAGFLILAVFLYYYLPAIVYLHQVKADAARKPELWQIPKAISQDNRAPIQGKQIRYSSLVFSTPWGEGKIARQGKDVALLDFGGSRSILFLNIGQSPFNFRTLAQQDANGVTRKLVGERAMNSNFDTEREVLNTDPHDLYFSLNRTRMIHTCMFVVAKWVYADRGETGIYEFRTDNVRGFQRGNPGKTGQVILDVYDRSDRLSTMIVSTQKNAPTRLSQAEINTFLASLEVDQSAASQ